MNRFDKVADVWENSRRMGSAEQIYKAIANKIELTSEMKVADIGTGTGLLLIHILPHIGEISGYDNSAKMLKQLDEKIEKADLKNVKSVFFDADKDKFSEKDYNLLVSSMTFHHIQNVSDFFKEIYSATAKGGQIAIADLETEDGSFHSNPDDSIKHLGFDKSEFKLMIEEAGFVNVEVESIFKLKKDNRDYPIFLATAMKL